MHGKYSERGIHMRSTQRGVYAWKVLREGYTREKYSERGIRTESTSERGIHTERTQRGLYTWKVLRGICTESTRSGSTGGVLDMEQGKDVKTHLFHLQKVKVT